MTCSPDLEIIDLTQVVGDINIACDYGDDEYNPHSNAAKWVLHSIEHGCGRGGARLACDNCKNIRQLSDAAVECDCGDICAPARHAYSSIEPLDRRPS